MQIRFTMSANSFDAASFIREIQFIPGKVTLWQELEDLKDALGPGFTIEAEVTHLTLPFSFLKFFLINKEEIKSIKEEEKTLMVDLSEKEFKTVTTLERPFMFRISSGFMQLFGNLGIDVSIYCHPKDLHQ